MPNTLLLIVTTDINVMVAESTGVAQVEDLMGSLGTEDSAVQASADEPTAVEFVASHVAVEATTTANPEMLASASASEEPVVGLVPVQVESAPVSVGVTRPVIKRGSGSAPGGSFPATTSWKN